MKIFKQNTNFQQKLEEEYEECPRAPLLDSVHVYGVHTSLSLYTHIYTMYFSSEFESELHLSSLNISVHFLSKDFLPHICNTVTIEESCQ